MTFITDCVHSTAEKINALVDSSRTVTWETFRQHVPVEEVEQLFPFYSYRHNKHNEAGELTAPMHIKDDYTVRFCKGVYDGKPVYFIVHSAIEYIFG